jgi:hypothetical protein
VVLWFDDDLFCTRTLLMVLHRLALHETGFEQQVRRAKLVDGVPRVADISVQSMMAASDAWHTIAAQDAAEIAAHGARLADAGEQWLADALRLELQWRILRVRSRVEIADIASSGGSDGVEFHDLLATWNNRHARLGLGDWQVWLLTAAAAHRGAVHVRGAEPVPSALHDGSFGEARVYEGADPEPARAASTNEGA